MDDPQMDYETLTNTKTQERVDSDNLEQLTLLHYILGVVTIIFSSFFIAHIIMGLTMAHNPSAFTPPPTIPPTSAGAPVSVPTAIGFPPDMGYVFAAMGSVVVLGGWTLGGLTVYAGRCLKMRKNYTFIQVTAGLNCVCVVPIGTALGVYTFVVLARPSVKALFQKSG